MKALPCVAALLLASSPIAFAQDVASPAQAPEAPLAAPADPLSQAVTAYGAFQSDVTSLRGLSFKKAADTQVALDLVAQSNPDAMTRGWIAYGALTAAQSPAFVAEVRKVAQAYGRDVAIRGFAFGSDYARLLKGGDEAMALILAAAAADGARIHATGESYRAASLDLQKAAWAKARLPRNAAAPRVKRLVELASSTAPRALAPEIAARLATRPATVSPASDPTAFGGRDFWDTLAAGPEGATATLTAFAAPALYQANPGQASALEAMLSLAALHALDAVDDLAPADRDRLLQHDHTNNCFRLAQMQFNQCISAAASHADSIACVGEAGLQTRAMCVRNVVQVSQTPVTFVNQN